MKKILLIEDSQNIADLIKIYMKDYFTLFHADTGEEGLSIFHKEQINLVLLDLVLPGMSGLEVLGEICKTSTTPIIILSSKNLDMDKILGLKMGADDYVTKPFNPLELQARSNASKNLLEKQLEYTKKSPAEPDDFTQIHFTDTIQMKNVSFTMEDTVILKEIDLIFEKGRNTLW